MEAYKYVASSCAALHIWLWQSHGRGESTVVFLRTLIRSINGFKVCFPLVVSGVVVGFGVGGLDQVARGLIFCHFLAARLVSIAWFGPGSSCHGAKGKVTNVIAMPRP